MSRKLIPPNAVSTVKVGGVTKECIELAVSNNSDLLQWDWLQSFFHGSVASTLNLPGAPAKVKPTEDREAPVPTEEPHGGKTKSKQAGGSEYLSRLPLKSELST